MRNLTIFTIVLLLGTTTTTVRAEHSDVPITTDGTSLSVTPADHGGELFFVYPGHFGEAVDPANVSIMPGFSGEGFNEDDLIGFNVRQELLYWDGAAMAIPPEQQYLTIEHPAVHSLDVNIDGTTGFQEGFDFIEVDADGDIHQHLHFVLHGPGEPDGLVPGAYGLWLELTSPQYETSNDFIILLNYGLEHEAFEAGVHYIGEYVIPEPGSLMLLAVAGLAIAARRSIA